jgi:metallo-beta-lactamase family protein
MGKFVLVPFTHHASRISSHFRITSLFQLDICNATVFLSPMRIHFFGATRTTTGSMYLFEINGKRLLLECGLFQGRREESIERNRKFPFDPKQVDAVVLSHAHIDHCGNLPNLCVQGFEGNIYCTFATRDLASIMLADSAQIQRDDAAFMSKKRARSGLPPVEPLYTAIDAEKAVRQFVAINYDRPFPVVEGVTVTFRDAGHILGSAQVVLDIHENGRAFRYLFSGDVGRGDDDVLRNPESVENVDYLQVESTYGGREHSPKANATAEIGQLVRKTLDRKGKVIIPCFSVGRTQQIVYTLHQLTLAGQLPKIPVFVDSPLSVNATEIYRLHPECFNETIYKFLQEKENPFGMENLTYIREVAHSMKLNDLKDPAIIISASGMAEAGRIRHHLKNNIGDSKNLVLFVGYCAEHTLGAQILAGQNPVNIFGEPQQIRAQIASLDSFSGHADKNELRRYVEAITGDIKKICVIHGEESQAMAFAQTLRGMKPKAQVIVPEYQQVVEI